MGQIQQMRHVREYENAATASLTLFFLKFNWTIGLRIEIIKPMGIIEQQETQKIKNRIFYCENIDSRG